MHKVIYKFRDLQDPTKHEYKKDDKFPFDDREILEERITELSSTSNLIGRILIEADENSVSIENGTLVVQTVDNKQNTPITKPSPKAKAKTNSKKK